METAIKSKSLNIGGMTCVGCQNTIERALRQQYGIVKARVDYRAGKAEIQYDTDAISPEEIVETIEGLGYQVLPEGGQPKTNYRRALGMLLIIASLFVALERTGLINLLAPTQLAEAGMNFGMLFVVGLITSVHCVAMCGGINLSQCLPRGGQPESSRWPISSAGLLYNLGRVISYTAVGYVVGAAGSAFTFSNTVQGFIKLGAGIFMVILGLNMLDLFPWMRRLSLSMPMSGNCKGGCSSAKSPLIVGLLNGLMPCGPLQAMQLYALSTGSPVKGALSMLVFALGTLPLMLGLGALSAALAKKHLHNMMTAGAVLVAVLGLSMFSQGLSLSGVAVPLLPANASDSSGSGPVMKDGVQFVESTLAPGRYPNITVEAGTPVEWVITAPQGSINGCNNRFYVPAYDITHQFQPGENVIRFTPDKAGVYQYSCWMGMIRGRITVVETGTPIDNTVDDADVVIPDPTPADYTIPTDALAVAELATDDSGAPIQMVDISLTDQGFSPAVMVVQAGTNVLWCINYDAPSATEQTLIMIPDYVTQLPISSGENGFYFYPEQSFDFSTDDNTFYGYVKVVEDITAIDEKAIKAEVTNFETLVWPPELYYSGAGGSCCQ